MDKKIDKFLATRVQADSKDGVEVQLWKRFEGYDVVVVDVNGVCFVNFFEKYDKALEVYEKIKEGGKYG